MGGVKNRPVSARGDSLESGGGGLIVTHLSVAGFSLFLFSLPGFLLAVQILLVEMGQQKK